MKIRIPTGSPWTSLILTSVTKDLNPGLLRTNPVSPGQGLIRRLVVTAGARCPLVNIIYYTNQSESTVFCENFIGCNDRLKKKGNQWVSGIKKKQDPAEINTAFKNVQGYATWKSYYLHLSYYPLWSKQLYNALLNHMKKKRKHPRNVCVSPLSTRISKNTLTCTRLITLHSFLQLL